MPVKHLFFSILLFSATPFAAIAQLSVGGGISYSTETEAIGLQPRVIYAISGPWRAGADFNYFLDGKERISYWDLSLNGHYAFLAEEKLTIYALAGLNFFHVNEDADATIPGFEDISDTGTGANVGAGVQLPLGRLSGLIEARYVLGDYDQLTLSACIMFPLDGR